ncbi:sulfatase [Paraglaciecola sp. L3A3]|uniref:sulfatase family protein n=1 Tax=Paraglaciecola sp. L3A3 TaxID=2686358 RepID=UPI00131AEE36|nr:sulfatase [Paraglaciecola sp. L3A3]
MKLQNLLLVFMAVLFTGNLVAKESRPNILFVLSDDQSSVHTSYAGAQQLHTPGFDRLANQGAYFTHSFTGVASCAPSRASILTGKSFWRNREASLLFGRLKKDHQVFTRLLSDAGYAVGVSGKSYSPANQNFESTYPLVDELQGLFNKEYKTHEKTPFGINSENYSASFIKFMQDKPKEQPFFFWLGTKEPHRAYKKGIGAENGINPDMVTVPDFLPDNTTIRNDIADYFFEIQWADNHLVNALNYLEEIGQLNNTLVVYTSDNGMPFPRAKATSYNYGVQMPLAMMWGDKIKPGRVIEDFVNHIDFAATFLDVAGAEIPAGLSGKSLLPILLSDKSGLIDAKRTFTLTGFERHVWARPDGEVYGRRVIHTKDWVYIHNFNPDRWPMGSPDFIASHQGIFGDVDAGPTKTFLLENKDAPEIEPLYHLSFSKLPEDELYHLPSDPEQINNVANNVQNQQVLEQLKAQLMRELSKDQDPRMQGLDHWRDYPFYGNKDKYLRGKYLKEYQMLNDNKLIERAEH